MQIKCHISAFLLLLLNTFTVQVVAFTDEEERWLNSVDEEKAENVNEGQLNFLQSTDKNVLHSINTLTITRHSIDTGWVSLHQCYRHLDQLPEVEITYQYRFIRHLKLVSKNNIDKAELHDQSITLSNINENAEICVSAEVRIFYQNPDQTFSLVNGPYHRKFLDGYYPYHVTLKIHYPVKQLAFISSLPVAQPGFSVVNNNSTLIVDTLFEGILNTEIIFKERKTNSSQ